MKSGVIVVCASKDTIRLKKYVFLIHQLFRHPVNQLVNHHQQFTSRLVSIFTVCLYRMIRLQHEMHCPIDGWEEKDLTDGWEQKLFFFFFPKHQYGIASHPPPMQRILSYHQKKKKILTKIISSSWINLSRLMDQNHGHFRISKNIFLRLILR